MPAKAVGLGADNARCCDIDGVIRIEAKRGFTLAPQALDEDDLGGGVILDDFIAIERLGVGGLVQVEDGLSASLLKMALGVRDQPPVPSCWMMIKPVWPVLRLVGSPRAREAESTMRTLTLFAFMFQAIVAASAKVLTGEMIGRLKVCRSVKTFASPVVIGAKFNSRTSVPS